MNASQKIQEVQKELAKANLDGWLLYDFRRTNDLACLFLNIDEHQMLSRRFFYWIPRQGEPVKILHRIEPYILDHFPGRTVVYSSWQELEGYVADALKGTKCIAMEYSPRNAIPYVSKVDAGTMEVIKDLGVKVVTSANLLQKYTAVCNDEQEKSHFQAAQVLDETAANAWAFISDHLKAGKTITEYDVQQYMMKEVDKKGCTHEGHFFCSVNEHSADGHYTPQKKGSSEIKKGDFVLIDLWCKLKKSGSVYADITRVGVASSRPTAKQQEIFEIVKKAQHAGLALIKSRFAEGKALMGWEIDAATRKVIEDAGYGKFFTHRTGHNMYDQDHGKGAHIDNLETRDLREILPGTCFTIEPGIYFPGDFGIRLEFDVYIDHQRGVHVTGGIQEEITCLL